jgi:hypothetical protein
MKDQIIPNLLSLSACGLPTGTLKLTLTTCEGAYFNFVSVGRCCHTCVHARHMLCVERELVCVHEHVFSEVRSLCQ